LWTFLLLLVLVYSACLLLVRWYLQAGNASPVVVNPQGGADRRQPVSSFMNQTSAGAASRPS
jgi:hypothetical protein